LCDTDLPDMSGLRFFRLLQQETRLRGIPFAFFSADTRVETKVVALRAGVDDYLTKPCDPAELSAKVIGIVNRQHRQRQIGRDRAYTLGGNFATMPFPDVVSILELSRRTGVLSITTPRAVGELCFDAGQVVHALFGNLSGADAFYRIMGEGSGQFEFTTMPLPAGSPRTIGDSVAALLMESARLIDHKQAGNAQSGPPSSALRSPGQVRSAATVAIAEKPIEALVPNAALATQFETAISDGFALGELKLWSGEELARWTRGEIGRDRCHVHLVSELHRGVSALLAIAGQISERWVMSALSREEKALGLAFFLRQERVMDLVLIDIQNPGTWTSCLKRCPALSIVAPPDANVLGIGPKALVELEALLRGVPPAALLWVAHDTIDAHLSPGVLTAPALSVHGELGDGELDLRALLVEGLRFWLARCKRTAPEAELFQKRRA
jgi:CheY-like chemotaxis protein